MKPKIQRRDFLGLSVATIAAASLTTSSTWSLEPFRTGSGSNSPIRLGVASYSFRKFDRTAVIGFMKQLGTPYLNVKEVHLPMIAPDEIRKASAEFATAGIRLTAAGTIYFTNDEDDDIRRKFEYCKIA